MRTFIYADFWVFAYKGEKKYDEFKRLLSNFHYFPTSGQAELQLCLTTQNSQSLMFVFIVITHHLLDRRKSMDYRHTKAKSLILCGPNSNQIAKSGFSQLLLSPQN